MFVSTTEVDHSIYLTKDGSVQNFDLQLYKLDEGRCNLVRNVYVKTERPLSADSVSVVFTELRSLANTFTNMAQVQVTLQHNSTEPPAVCEELRKFGIDDLALSVMREMRQISDSLEERLRSLNVLIPWTIRVVFNLKSPSRQFTDDNLRRLLMQHLVRAAETVRLYYPFEIEDGANAPDTITTDVYISQLEKIQLHFQIENEDEVLTETSSINMRSRDFCDALKAFKTWSA
ncbi:hypothetical protein AAVH_37933 [Aphelenchoides avenae]|nr:hypothetical protein AAVH_37933 [Aphelenchus avenae]